MFAFTALQQIYLFHTFTFFTLLHKLTKGNFQGANLIARCAHKLAVHYPHPLISTSMTVGQRGTKDVHFKK